MNPKVIMVLRILLGIFLLVFGINKFAHFLEFPPIPGDGGTLMGIYISSGFMYFIGVLEILAALALIAGRFVPLALTIGTAIMLNAVLFHALHDPGTIAGGLIGLVLCIVLVMGYKDRFKGLLSA